MKDKKSTNVLITTISKLQFNARINCYHTIINNAKKNNKKLCIGISQQEAGAKYFLSKYKIDRIVAICSEDIYNGVWDDNGKKIHTINFKEDFENLRNYVNEIDITSETNFNTYINIFKNKIDPPDERCFLSLLHNQTRRLLI